MIVKNPSDSLQEVRKHPYITKLTTRLRNHITTTKGIIKLCEKVQETFKNLFTSSLDDLTYRFLIDKKLWAERHNLHILMNDPKSLNNPDGSPNQYKALEKDQL